MASIRRFINWLQSNKERFNKVVPWFLTIYFVLICFPYIFARVSFLDNLFSNSGVAFIFRFGFLFLYFVFGTILIIANKLKIKKTALVIMILMLVLFVVNIFASPDSIVAYSFYFSGKISVSTSEIGVYTKLVHIARFGGDLVFLFFLLNCYPYCLKNRNQFSLIVSPAIAIALIGVLYTFVFERGILKAVIDGTISPENIKSIFHSKNAYGIFLFNGAVAAAFVFFSDARRWIKSIVLTIPLFFVTSFLINCKLAAVCILVLLVLSYVYAIIRCFKTRPYISFTMLGIALALSIGLILVFAIPQFRNIGFIGKIYDKIIDTFKNFNIASFIGRTTEWEMVPRMTNGIFSVIGFSSATGYSLITAYTSINGSTAAGLYDLHNAYIDFYAYHGIVGCIFLLGLYIFVGYLIYKLFKKNKLIALMVTMILLVSILFGMAETYRLFISMSANTFALNIMILGILLFELKADKGLFNIDNLVFSIFKKKNKEIPTNE